MKNSVTLIIIGILIIAGGWFVFSDGKTSSNVVLGDQQKLEVQNQKIILSQSGYNYNDIYAESGMPIEISADNSVGGCLRSIVFNVNGKKYSKYLKTSQDILELPVLSRGTYTFSCVMGMGFGKLIVK